jgi:hypothetical protein
MFHFVRNCPIVFQNGCTIFAVPTAMNESSYCSTSWSAFGIVGVLDFDPSNRCIVVSNCHFPNDR